MYAEPGRYTRKTSTEWHRRLSVLACLLVFLTALFGHIEQPSAVAVAADQAIIGLHHGDVPSDDVGAIVPHHCLHHGQCYVQAVLPAAPAIVPHGSKTVGIADFRLGENHAVSPLRRPPKTPETM